MANLNIIDDLIKVDWSLHRYGNVLNLQFRLNNHNYHFDISEMTDVQLYVYLEKVTSSFEHDWIVFNDFIISHPHCLVITQIEGCKNSTLKTKPNHKMIASFDKGSVSYEVIVKSISYTKDCIEIETVNNQAYTLYSKNNTSNIANLKVQVLRVM